MSQFASEYSRILKNMLKFKTREDDGDGTFCCFAPDEMVWSPFLLVHLWKQQDSQRGNSTPDENWIKQQLEMWEAKPMLVKMQVVKEHQAECEKAGFLSNWYGGSTLDPGQAEDLWSGHNSGKQGAPWFVRKVKDEDTATHLLKMIEKKTKEDAAVKMLKMIAETTKEDAAVKMIAETTRMSDNPGGAGPSSGGNSAPEEAKASRWKRRGTGNSGSRLSSYHVSNAAGPPEDVSKRLRTTGGE